jgi:hypothetical protein
LTLPPPVFLDANVLDASLRGELPLHLTLAKVCRVRCSAEIQPE